MAFRGRAWGRAQSKGSAGLILPQTLLPSPCLLDLHAPTHHPHLCNHVPPWPPPSPSLLTLLFHYKSTSARPSTQLLCTPLDSMPILYLFSGSWAGPHASQGPRPGGSSAYFLEEGVREGRSLEASHPMGRARTRDGHTCVWFWLCCPCGETGWGPAGGVGIVPNTQQHHQCHLWPTLLKNQLCALVRECRASLSSLFF